MDLPLLPHLMSDGGGGVSKRVFAEYINFDSTLVDVYINSLKPDSKKGIYYFDSPITKDLSLPPPLHLIRCRGEGEAARRQYFE